MLKQGKRNVIFFKVLFQCICLVSAGLAVKSDLNVFGLFRLARSIP